MMETIKILPRLRLVVSDGAREADKALYDRRMTEIVLTLLFGFGDAVLKAQKELAEKKRAMEDGKRPIHFSS